MNQFKDYFLGLKKDIKRAASSQKCLRTADLDEVGKTACHHSFFEMLGNFSFGDYFKDEAITWAWEFLTQEVKIAPARLRVSVHEKDDEAYSIWQRKIKVRSEWIYRLGDKSNFWPANAPADGPNGPCGPCSEIYYDQDPSSRDEDITGQRFAEIWNLVFTQYDRQEGGRLVPLASQNIDTGMGLERLACVLQGKMTNYEIDIFQPLNTQVAKQLGITQTRENEKQIYAVSDHLRAVVFSVSDGVIPSNEGRGYVIRKLIRRALWLAHQMVPSKTIREPFLYKLVPVVAFVMRLPYPELESAQTSIASMLRAEEERFLGTLDTGLFLLKKHLAGIRTMKERLIPGQIVFELYDTYGFPDELTRAIAHAEGLEIDQRAFEDLMDQQRKRAAASSHMSGQIFSSSELEKQVAALPPTTFLGYETLSATAVILLTEISGGRGWIVLDQSPFYGESGGQVGDQGRIRGQKGSARVVDTQKRDGHLMHAVEIETGQLGTGDRVEAEVDLIRRNRTMRHHTATHLLHAALRKILGPEVRQLGSLVSPEKLRFDYSYSSPLTSEQIRWIEDDVNDQILRDIAVAKEEKPLQTAREEGAIAFFGEKYGKVVRVVSVPGYSKELCGGTHCNRTGQIGSFIIVNDSSIGSGTRRVEALAGDAALNYFRDLRDQMGRVAAALKTTPKELEIRVARLQESVKKLEKERLRPQVSIADAEKILKESRDVGPYRLAHYREKGLTIDQLRHLSDEIRSRSTQTVFLLASEREDKIHFIIGLSPDLKEQTQDAKPKTAPITAIDLGKELAPLLKANAGGRADLVQGGAPNEGQLESSWPAIIEGVVLFLREKAASH